MAFACCLVLLASGCTGSGSPTSSLRVSTLSPPASPTEGPPNEVAIAYVGSLAGPVQDEAGYRAAELAVSAANAGAFGHLPLSVRLVPVSLRGKPIPALTSLDEVIADPTLVAAVGPVSSPMALAVAPVLNRAGVPLVTFATDPSLGTENLDRVLRAVVDDNAVSAAAAAYIAEVLKPACVFLVSDGSAYGNNLVAGVTAGLSSSGIRTQPEKAATLTAAGVIRVARRARRSGCETTFFGGASVLGARLAAMVRAVGLDLVAPLGADSLRGVGFRPWSASASGSIGLSALDELGEPSSSSQRQFVDAYESRYGTAPVPPAGETWDALQMVFAALKAGKITRGSIGDFLRSIQGFPGVTKTYSYRPDSGGSLVTSTDVYVYQAQGVRWNPMGPINVVLKL